MALALDDHALEDLDAPARALDHLEVHLDAIARREVGDAAQLLTLDAFDNGAHKKKASSERKVAALADAPANGSERRPRAQIGSPVRQADRSRRHAQARTDMRAQKPATWSPRARSARSLRDLLQRHSRIRSW